MDVDRQRPPAVEDPRYMSSTLVAGLLVVVFVLSVIAVNFAPPGSEVAAWWPANALAAGMVARMHPRRWAALLTLIGLVSAGANAVGGRTLEVSALFALTNVAECVVIALVLGAHRRRPILRTPRNLLRLMLATSAGSVTAGVCAAATVAIVLDGSFLPVFRSVAASHAAGSLLVLPLMLLWADPDARVPAARSVAVRALSVTATLGSFAAVHAPNHENPIAFVPFLFVVAGAQVLSVFGVAAVSLASGFLVTVLSARGGGPFGSADGLSPIDVGALVQLDLVGIALISLPLAMTVAQRRGALASALASRETYRRGITESVIGVLLVRPEPSGLLVLEANGPACSLLGASRESLLDRPWTAGLGEHQRDFHDAVDQMLAGRISAWDLEMWVDRDRPTRVQATMSWLPDTSSGNLIVVQLVDQTDVKLSRIALESERDFTRALLSATLGAAIIATDSRGEVTYLNEGAAAMLGDDARTLTGRALTVLYTREELTDLARQAGGATGFDALVERTRRTGLDVRRDSTWVRSDGVAVRVSSHINPLRGDLGEVIGFLIVASDKTTPEDEQDSLRADLVRERDVVDRLLEVDRIRSDLYSSISHELRTPLTSIIGFTEMLVDNEVGALSPPQHKVLLRIDRSSRRLLSLIENVLTASRIEAGVNLTTHREVDLTEIARRAMAAIEHLTWDRELDVHCRLPKTAVTVIGDDGGLERAISNLLSNAIKFTPDGGRVALTVRVSTSSPEAVLEVADSGAGISEADQKHLFTRYFRAVTPGNAAVQGTGLGLKIVKDVVEENGGTVSLTSTLGRGTTVSLCFPLSAGAS